MKSSGEIREYIISMVRQYHLAASKEASPWVAGTAKVPYAGRIYDEKELEYLVDSALEFWLTSGTWTDKFEKGLAGFLDVGQCHLVNSGSSANLLAFMALTSSQLGERALERGDEIITLAAGFPTTVAPIVQYGCTPVFVDIELPGYNIDCEQLEEALSDRTKALILAHTLGNPFDLDRVTAFCRDNNLWLIEDNCDALGSTYRGRRTGTFGDIGTSSFYPPHHITMGEGGAVYTDDALLSTIVLSLRDWGRDCICPPGKDNTCGNRFSQKFGGLPSGYDHKYVYSHFGYNLKATDLQAAVGCAQLKKLPDFIQARRSNFRTIRDGISNLEEFFILPEPTPGSDPSWFGFLMTVRDNAFFTRNELVSFLERKMIQTRMLFAGNLTKHPCFDGLREKPSGYRTVGPLVNTDLVMNNTLWIGLYPGLTQDMIAYVVETLQSFARGSSS